MRLRAISDHRETTPMLRARMPGIVASKAMPQIITTTVKRQIYLVEKRSHGAL